MVQEILSYIIIGSALAVIAFKAWKQFVPKKKVTKKTSSTSNSVLQGHNCSECSAECQLRDLPKYIIEKNLDECVQVENKSKALQS